MKSLVLLAAAAFTGCGGAPPTIVASATSILEEASAQPSLLSLAWSAAAAPAPRAVVLHVEAAKLGSLPAPAVALLQEVDGALRDRIDLLSAPGSSVVVTAWRAADGTLLGADVRAKQRRERFALFRGEGAPPGYYDSMGLSLAGPLLARPLPLAAMTSNVGARTDPFTRRRRLHLGVDYRVEPGTPVFAVADGRVVSIGSGARSGHFVKLAHAGGYTSSYLHLSRVAAGLRVGSTVKQGHEIARSGNTGRSTAPHLHYELRRHGVPLDPTRLKPRSSQRLVGAALRDHQSFLSYLESIR